MIVAEVHAVQRRDDVPRLDPGFGGRGVGPHGVDPDAGPQIGIGDLAMDPDRRDVVSGGELGQGRACILAPDRELLSSRIAFGVVHAHDLSVVRHHRAAGRSRVDGRVMLDRVVDRGPGLVDDAARTRDDAAREREFGVAEGVAGGVDRQARTDIALVPVERCEGTVARDLEERQVGAFGRPDDLRGVLGPIGTDPHGQLAGAGGHVVVREHESRRIDEEARARTHKSTRGMAGLAERSGQLDLDDGRLERLDRVRVAVGDGVPVGDGAAAAAEAVVIGLGRSVGGADGADDPQPLRITAASDAAASVRRAMRRFPPSVSVAQLGVAGTVPESAPPRQGTGYVVGNADGGPNSRRTTSDKVSYVWTTGPSHGDVAILCAP